MAISSGPAWWGGEDNEDDYVEVNAMIIMIILKMMRMMRS